MTAEAKKILEETLEYNHCGNIIDLDSRVGNAILKAMDIYLKSKAEAISDETLIKFFNYLIQNTEMDLKDNQTRSGLINDFKQLLKK